LGQVRAGPLADAPRPFSSCSPAAPRRKMRAATVYVAGLPYSANETTLRTLFQNHGLNPVDVHIVRDSQSGRGKGFGFVSMSSQSEAAQAIGALNGSLVDGRSLILAPATPRSTDSR
jgi:RNA recognition motif-containing protein